MVSSSCPVIYQEEFLTCWGGCLKLADKGAKIPELDGKAVGFRERLTWHASRSGVTFHNGKVMDLGFLADFVRYHRSS